MILRPFFSYYGAKWRMALRYPPPLFGKIIEPFAGSACYALHYPEREVLLVDADPVVVGLWQYLIAVSESEILALPDRIDDVAQAPEKARALIGYCLNRANVRPMPRPSPWMRKGLKPGSFWGPQVKQRIAGQLRFIRHWRVLHASYATLSNEPATWFIDPPYNGRPGSHYRHGSKKIDYAHLAGWCRDREGQTIVCEAQGADWLPFEAFGRVKSNAKRYSAEAIWTSTPRPGQMELPALAKNSQAQLSAG